MLCMGPLCWRKPSCGNAAMVVPTTPKAGLGPSLVVVTCHDIMTYLHISVYEYVPHNLLREIPDLTMHPCCSPVVLATVTT